MTPDPRNRSRVVSVGPFWVTRRVDFVVLDRVTQDGDGFVEVRAHHREDSPNIELMCDNIAQRYLPRGFVFSASMPDAAEAYASYFMRSRGLDYWTESAHYFGSTQYAGWRARDDFLYDLIRAGRLRPGQSRVLSDPEAVDTILRGYKRLMKRPKIVGFVDATPRRA